MIDKTAFDLNALSFVYSKSPDLSFGLVKG